MTTPPGEARVRAWLDGLSPDAQAALAADYATHARADGAFVVLPDGGEVAIPPILTPVGVPRAAMRQISDDAHRLIAALVRLTEPLLSDPAHLALRARLFGAFSPLEARGLAETWRTAAELSTVRVDFLVDRDGRHRALEVNATIPAMQGYSDAIAAAFLRAAGRARGVDGEQLIAANGRNTDDLLDSLLAHHQQLTGEAERSLSIAIVARAGDAQRGELEHYVRRWSTLGHRARIVTPGEVRIDGARGAIIVKEALDHPDLFYRHVFARRLDPDSDFARMCLAPDQFRIRNPLASHLEVKAMLGLLSAAADGGGLIALDDDEADMVRRTVPWTRLLSPGPTRGPDGSDLADLAAWTRAEGAHLVLKRSWDYGGKGVYLGADLDGASTQARLRALTGRDGAVSWSDLCDHALADADAWVVQALVPADRVGHLRVEDGGGAARDLYVDLSAFTNLGVAPRPAGGAVRASENRIVNILGGGGLAPLVVDEVLAELA